MKTLLVGCGNIGSIAAKDFAENMPETELTVADYDKTRAKQLAQNIRQPNVSWKQLNVKNQATLIKTLKKYDLAMGFLPGNFGYHFAEACVKANTDLVDVSFMAENPLTLNKQATEAETTIVPDCGLAPGISNILVGHFIAMLDEVEKVHIMVGGLPETPVPPLGYVITWSPESLIDEYTRKATIVQNHKKVDIEALTGLEEIHFDGVGKLEAFYTDGLRTLTHTISEAKEMWEKTLRYPRHVAHIETLKVLGFFDEKPVMVEGKKVSPRKLTAKLLEQKLKNPSIRDIVAMKVKVTGTKNGRQKNFVYNMLDFYDQKHSVTSMARTTAYPASIVGQLIIKKTLKQVGVCPPEKIGMDEKIFDAFMGELKRRDIKITEETESG